MDLKPLVATVKHLRTLGWGGHIKRTVQIVNSREFREYLLLAVTILSFVSGAVLVALAMYILLNLETLVEHRLDTLVKGSNLTWTLLARYGSIVPNKDYIPQRIDLGPWITWFPARLFDMGVAVMTFSAIGMYVSTSGKPLRLYFLVVCLLATIIAQLMFVLNLMDYHSQFHYHLRHKLSSYLETRYEFGAETHDPFSFIMNAAMLMGECCGINGPQDFMLTNHSFVHVGGNQVTHNATLRFPLACCQRSFIERGFHTTLDCALSWSKQAVNNRGCYKTMFAYLNDKFGHTVLWVYVSITYIELLQVLLCLSLARQLRREKFEALNFQSSRAIYVRFKPGDCTETEV